MLHAVDGREGTRCRGAIRLDLVALAHSLRTASCWCGQVFGQPDSALRPTSDRLDSPASRLTPLLEVRLQQHGSVTEGDGIESRIDAQRDCRRPGHPLRVRRQLELLSRREWAEEREWVVWADVCQLRWTWVLGAGKGLRVAGAVRRVRSPLLLPSRGSSCWAWSVNGECE